MARLTSETTEITETSDYYMCTTTYSRDPLFENPGPVPWHLIIPVDWYLLFGATKIAIFIFYQDQDCQRRPIILR